MRRYPKKVVDTWLEANEALIEVNNERLESFEPEDHEPNVALPEPTTPSRNWLLIAAIFLAIIATVIVLALMEV